jgi:hypothetical protein
MSSRSYTGLILLETLFDSLPEINPDLTSFSTSVFTPHVPVVESDCGTALGELTPVNYELEGKVELATGNIISKERVEQLLSMGVYQTSVRTLSTCVSKNGVCQACYHSTHQYEPLPAVGSSVQVFPEYVSGTDVLALLEGSSSAVLSLSTEQYDRAYVYYSGTLINPQDYSVLGNTLQLKAPVPHAIDLTVRFTTITRAPFLGWLAGTYSGSLLGMMALPSPKLPIRKRLLTSLLPTAVLDLLSTQAETLNQVPTESITYLEKITDPLEKALFVIALHGIFLNVN